MSQFTDNDVTIDSATYDGGLTVKPDQPCRKLSFTVEGTAIYFQTLDRIHGAFSNSAPEIKMLPGFGSFTFRRPIYGFRVRKPAAASSDPILSYVYDA